MSSPAVGMAYYLWRRARVLLWLGAAWLALLALGVRHVGAFGSPAVALPATAPLVVIFIQLLGVLVLESPDALSRASGYPAHFMRLPARTAALVGWPMSYGAAFIVGVTLLTTRGVLGPLGVTHARSAALVIACGVAWVQALFWCPSPVPALRVVLVAPLICGLGFGGVFLASRGWPDVVIGGVFGAAWIAAFAVATWGVGVARSGGGRTAVRVAWRPTRGAGAGGAFRSVAAAQTWFEWRRTVCVLPLFAAGSVILIGTCAWLGLANERRHGYVPLEFGPVTFSLPLMVAVAFFASPVMLSSMASNLGRSEFFARSPVMPAFLAARPISTAQYVGLKFRAVALSTLGLWVVMMAGMLLTMAMFTPAERDVLPALVRRFAGAGRAPAVWIVVALVCMTWRNSATQLWLPLTGRGAIVSVITIGMMVLFALLALGGYWVWRHPATWGTARAVGAHVLEGMAAVKVAASIAAGLGAWWLGLVRGRAVVGVIVAWGAVVAGFAVAMRWVAPGYPHVVAMGVVSVPLGRVLAAPVALWWNRHR